MKRPKDIYVKSHVDDSSSDRVMQHEGADGQIEELSTKHLPNSMTISPSATTNTLRLGSYPKAKTETPTENNT